MAKKIKVIQFGLGAMGSEMAKIVLKKRDLELVGAIVRREEQNGKDIGDLIGLKKKTGIKAYTNPKELYKKVKADVMLHAAVSYAPLVWKQIRPAVESGINVITIAEEMGYPYIKYPKICKEINRVAKRKGVRVLGSGINPGFAMDLLPVLISGICEHVDSIRVIRVIDFSPFGQAIQNNIGIGMNESEFKKKIKEGKLPLHIGLPESSSMVAAAFGWKIDKIVETREPVIANKHIHVPGYKHVPKGKVAGFNHRCFAYSKGRKVITLEELGRVDPNEDYKNTIIINGKPRITEVMNVPTGKITTTSHAVNLIPAVLKANPGLLTMLDLTPAPALPLK